MRKGKGGRLFFLLPWFMSLLSVLVYRACQYTCLLFWSFLFSLNYYNQELMISSRKVKCKGCWQRSLPGNWGLDSLINLISDSGFTRSMWCLCFISFSFIEGEHFFSSQIYLFTSILCMISFLFVFLVIIMFILCMIWLSVIFSRQSFISEIWQYSAVMF